MGPIQVIERDVRRDATCQQPLDQAFVKVQPCLVDGAVPLWQHTRPGDGEAVGVEIEARYQVEVLWPAMLMVAGDAAGAAIPDCAARRAVPFPVALTLASP